MEINTNPKTKQVEEYDFVFNSGLTVPITLDKGSGDSMEILSDRILIRIPAKPSPHDPDLLTQAETTIVFLTHLAMIQQRDRIVAELTPEQQAEWKDTIKRLGSVH